MRPDAVSGRGVPVRAQGGITQWGVFRLIGLSNAPRRLEATDVKTNWDCISAIALLSALCLGVIGYCDGAARAGEHWADNVFWVAIAVLYFPFALRLLWPGVAEGERVGLVLLLGLALYLVKVLNSPLGFTTYDEFLHWVTANTIVRDHRLFGLNTLLPVSSLYPGLELVTTAFAALSGLSVFPAGLVVIGAARLVFVSALYLVLRRVSGSPRIGSLGVLVYTNSDFVFFDAQFSYESMALALAAMAMLADVHFAPTFRADPPPSGSLVRGVFTAAPFLLALAVTHHMTAYFVSAFLTTVAVARLGSTAAARERVRAVAVATLAIAACGGWDVWVKDPASSYVIPIFVTAFNEVKQIVVGFGSSRHLFVSDTGVVVPEWKRWVGLSAVGLQCTGLAIGFFRTLRPAEVRPAADMGGRPRLLDSVRPRVFALLTILYPFCLLLRLTHRGWEIADRSTAFLFLGIALVVATGVVDILSDRPARLWRAGLLSAAATVMFIGGMTSSCCTVVPGPYAVAADSLSIEPIGIEAARWSERYLGRGNKIATDRINRLVQAAYGGQRPITSLYDHVDIAPLLLSNHAKMADYDVLKQSGTDYVVIDERLSTGRPMFGVYFEGGEERDPRSGPPQLGALDKFDQMARVDRVFDTGPIAIYDVRRLR